MLGVARGEDSAVRQLYRRFEVFVRQILKARAGPRDRDDLVQEVFLRLWKSAGRFDHTKGSLSGWVAMVTRYVWIDSGRHANARERGGTGLPKQISIGTRRHVSVEDVTVVDPVQSPLAALVTAERLERSRKHLAVMDTAHRNAVEMAVRLAQTPASRRDGVSRWGNVARAIGTYEGTLKVRASRGRQRLQRLDAAGL